MDLIGERRDSRRDLIGRGKGSMAEEAAPAIGRRRTRVRWAARLGIESWVGKRTVGLLLIKTKTYLIYTQSG